ncbi:PREDICTED: ankyrin repeat and LEM domain-containing protein 2 isoform X2 [Dinoponera quadriceps]|uniref:Ankyrin repeat and LEM domain-containing protein 2 isoform X2 n=1 Tax=Dinoponera quadriceps TaxID=609295 RepID=A0A6P3XBM9_DINQU|nr:PREDICTED: ankyrin repeat and LEM domain-containing protein 2 isoform X2 [Dinoponera quadriceps]
MSSLCSRVCVVGEDIVVSSNVPHGSAVDPLDDHFDAEKIAMDGCEDAQPACDTRSNLPKEAIFHAVYVPPDNNKDSANVEEYIHIYQDMPDALRIIKEHKKARLKTFKNRSDAEAYARTGHVQSGGGSYPVPTTTVTLVQEICSNFKAPKPQELVGFRKLIESGNIENVRSIVWANPRYLISSGDTPAILQMGSRYNALHIAVKANRPDMCELILKTVGNPTFIQLHYGDDECKSYLDPAQIMLDLYLNTPDRGLNETPLHFAVKFGHKDIVRILVSYSQCVKTLRNKYEQQPIDIICSRKCQEDEDLKREIRLLLEDQFYVPVLRTEDNTYQPTIGEPFSPSSTFISSLNKDPISPRLEVRAFAGPMSKPQALEFRRKWKTPPRTISTSAKKGQGDAPSIINSPIANIALRLQDTEKGLERVGRDLAEVYQVPWKEYWPFLKDFVDFRNDEGLTKLEKYLEQRFKDYKDQLFYSRMVDLVNNTNTNAPANCERITEKMDSLDVSEIEGLCEKLRSCSLSTKFDEVEEEEDDDSGDSEFFTPPSTPELFQYDSDDDDMENAEEEGPVIFIEGSSPTKLDHAVYNALSSEISSRTFPYVYRWRHEMQLAIKRDPCRFNNARLPRRKLFTST